MGKEEDALFIKAKKDKKQFFLLRVVMGEIDSTTMASLGIGSWDGDKQIHSQAWFKIQGRRQPLILMLPLLLYRGKKYIVLYLILWLEYTFWIFKFLLIQGHVQI